VHLDNERISSIDGACRRSGCVTASVAGDILRKRVIETLGRPKKTVHTDPEGEVIGLLLFGKRVHFLTWSTPLMKSSWKVAWAETPVAARTKAESRVEPSMLFKVAEAAKNEECSRRVTSYI
jgi:hypothetical protein